MTIRKVVAVIEMLISLSLLISGIDGMDKASSGLEVLKAFFWIGAGGTAFAAFVEDFKKDKWPF